MRSVVADIQRWREEGKRIAIARVAGVERSAPRLPGSTMVVSEAGEVAGSVSGGCVEGAVVQEAMEVLEGGPPRRLTYGISDDDAFGVGLTCGGTIHVFVEPLDWFEVFDQWAAAVDAGRDVALVTYVDGEQELGTQMLVGHDGVLVSRSSEDDLARVVAREAVAMLDGGGAVERKMGHHGEALRDDVAVLFEDFAPPPQMVIFGAVDFSAALAEAARFLGFRVVVCDARGVFATPARISAADEIVVAWPQELWSREDMALGPRDAVCVLTHDHKFDVPAIVGALRTRAGYIGAMGSRRTTEQRNERLLAEGVAEADLKRVRAPIGLDIGGRTPEETAISICAELISHRSGRPGSKSLDEVEGPIHDAAPDRV